MFMSMNKSRSYSRVLLCLIVMYMLTHFCLRRFKMDFKWMWSLKGGSGMDDQEPLNQQGLLLFPQISLGDLVINWRPMTFI